MLSYVFMRILERRPRSYDRWMGRASRGRVPAAKRAVAGLIPPGARVLELGCGTGELASLLVETRGCDVVAIDGSPAMVEQARRRVADAGLGDRVTVQQLGVEGMDRLDPTSFDAVVATFVLSELSDDERRYALAQAARVLRPGGCLVLADEVRPRSSGRRVLYALARVPAVALTYLVTGTTTRPLEQLPDELAAAGLALERELRRPQESVAVVLARRVG